MEKERFVIDERPQTEVYTTPSGFVGIKQVLRGEETVILLTADETRKVIGFLRESLMKLGEK